MQSCMQHHKSLRATASSPKMTARAARSSIVCCAVTNRQNVVGKEQRDGLVVTERRRLLSALAVSIGTALVLRPSDQALAGLNRSSDAASKYKDMMKKMQKENGGASLSAESMYNESGGACGIGYELKVEKVLGSSCVCVDESKCGEGAEGERKDISQYERSFGGGQ